MVKALPETEICGTWLAEELLNCTATLSSHGFLVRGLVSDSHPSNVKAFQIIKEKFPGDDRTSDLMSKENSGKTNFFALSKLFRMFLTRCTLSKNKYVFLALDG